MKVKASHIGVSLIALMTLATLSVIPASAWVYPDDTEDTKFEMFGPRLDRILINLYATDIAEFTGLETGEIDVIDWPLTKFYLDRWSSPPYDAWIQIWNYGGEAGYFLLDLNNNNDEILMDGTPNPVYPNPNSVVEFRQAIAYLVNRTHYIQVIVEGMGLPMYVPVPNYMEPVLPPGVQKYEPPSRAAAAALLDAGGFPWEDLNGNGVMDPGERYWDRNGNLVRDPGEDFTYIIYGRSDHTWRNDIAVHINGEMQAVGIATDLRLQPISVCFFDVMGDKAFNMYTGGWIFVGPEPDYLYDLYHGSMYWVPGFSPNYDGIDDPVLNSLLETIKFANTPEEGWTAVEQFKVYWSEKCFAIPLFSTSGYKAHRLNYLGTPGVADAEDPYEGDAWYGIVNEMGFGVNSWWTFLNARPSGHPTGDFVAPGPGHMTMRYGFKHDKVEWLNPVYAEWYWDWEVIGKIYDGGAARNPYDLSEWVPQLYKRWVAGTWTDPVTGEVKSKVTITLRPDAYWMDGVPITVADVEYTLVEMCKVLVDEKGLMPPWWYPTVQFMRSFYQIDTYTIEILLDVKSAWAMGWVIGNIVLPKHIWKPIVDASTAADNIIHTHHPDKNLIGSGPYRLSRYYPTPAAPMFIELVANRPGSVVTTDFSGAEFGDPILSPYGYFNQEPTYLNVLPEDGKFKRNIPHAPGVKPTTTEVSFNLNITEQNRHATAAVQVKKYVYLDGSLLTGFPKIIDLAPGETILETLPLTLSRGAHTVKVAIHIENGTWTSHWENATVNIWVTILEDIGLRYFDTWHEAQFGKGEVIMPDGVVDIDDVIVAALAFGAIPGHPRWSAVADITGDALIDIDDIILIALMFGKWP